MDQAIILIVIILRSKNMFDIKDVLYSVTNFCLGSCVYCNIKSLCLFEHDKETTVKDFEKLITDPYLDNMNNIHLTGGEPILSPKLWGICQAIKKYKPNIRVNMPVSGFFPYATYRYVKKIHELLPQIRIDISVDGIHKETHEKTRGQGSWEPLNKTIELLDSIKGLKIQFEFTLMETNYDELQFVEAWAKSLDYGFYLCFPRFGTRFAHSYDKQHEHSQSFIDSVEEQIKDGWCKIRPLNAQIWACQKANWQHKPVYHDCSMGLRSIDVDPFGNVYPCMVYNKKQIFGNIKYVTLRQILQSPNTKEILNKIKNRECQVCPMAVCPMKENFTIDGERVEF